MLPSFILYRHDRHLRSGGGVALYVRNDLVSKHVLSSANAEDKHPEYIFVEISGTSRDKAVVGVVYKPPNTSHLDDLEDELEAITASYRNIIVLGDFNSDLSKNFYGDQLRSLCEGFNLKIVEYHSTHHLENSDSWLDVCIVDDQEKVLDSEQSLQPFLSSHELISLTYNYKVGRQRLNNFSYRNWNAIDNDMLQNLCDDVDIDTMRSLETVDEMNNYLHKHLSQVIDTVAPEKTICPRRPPALWFTHQIKELQRRRDKLYRIFKRTGYAYKEYVGVRRLVKSRISEEKRRYFDRQLRSAKNSREMWNDLRKLGLVKRKSAEAVIGMDLDDLNDFFIQSSSFHNGPVDVQDIALIRSNDNVFNFSELNSVTVKKSIMRLTSNSVGPDNFSIKAYKCTLPFLLPLLTELFNKSLTTGVFPVEWKLSHVIPIPKKPNASDCTDFRPISLLSNISKALERCVHDQIVKYITDNNYIDEYQTGFREGLNTQTAVVKFCDDVRIAMNESQITIAVLFDLSKAFDSVNHEILLHKLSHMNFSDLTINWIKSYLTQRRQSVYYNNSKSSWKDILNGVPQGSVLGPLLFTLYIADLAKRLNCQYLFYADDLIIYISCCLSQINEYVIMLNDEIRKIVDWCSFNCLKLNALKTMLLFLGVGKKLTVIIVKVLKI